MMKILMSCISQPNLHYQMCKQALEKRKHVICENHLPLE